mmetsp:Transcript_6223/g.19813  ORF Transcript_6223/g.19813 Transcript_6223/m.19813 type:complete len:231 (+) Transcript_6223:578-1270(+)
MLAGLTALAAFGSLAALALAPLALATLAPLLAALPRLCLLRLELHLVPLHLHHTRLLHHKVLQLAPLPPLHQRAQDDGGLDVVARGVHTTREQQLFPLRCQNVGALLRPLLAVRVLLRQRREDHRLHRVAVAHHRRRERLRIAWIELGLLLLPSLPLLHQQLILRYQQLWIITLLPLLLDVIQLAAKHFAPLARRPATDGCTLVIPFISTVTVAVSSLTTLILGLNPACS